MEMMQMYFVNVCYIPFSPICMYECNKRITKILLSNLSVAIVHTTPSNCTEGNVQLAEGDSEYGGRVEVCINKAWGTVCSPGWGNQEARVVCNQIGATTLGIYFLISKP